MRKLTYYVACSADRFICHADGSVGGFLTEGEHLSTLFKSFPETLPTHLHEVLGIDDNNKVFDTVLMGRNTYEVGLKEGITSPYSTLKQYIFSSSMEESPHKNVKLVKENALEFVSKLKQVEGKDIWLCGGGKLASTLFSEIDSLILKVNPFLMGSGIPLFSDAVKQTALELVDSKIYPNGFMLLHYLLNH